MPSVLLSESLAFELGGREPWPNDVKLYQPNVLEQILLPDHANCLAVQTFLTMSGLHHDVEERHNAADMSPTGRVPFLKCGKVLVAELDRIISFVHTKGISLSNHLSGEDRADMRAYMSLINNVLFNAERYLTWLDPTIYDGVTYYRAMYRLPQPIRNIVVYMKRREVQRSLQLNGWAKKSTEDVYAEVDKCFQALAVRLGSAPQFFDKITELDALLFGHLFTIITTELPDTRLLGCVRKHGNLLNFCTRIESIYFGSASSVRDPRGGDHM